MGYGYDRLLGDIEEAHDKRYAQVFRIGKSLLYRDIHCLQIGTGAKKIALFGAFHALETITAAFLMKFVRRYGSAVRSGGEFFGRDASLLAKNVSLFIVPMVNPDGAEIALGGAEGWQANARGVDINHNFDADWQPILDAPAPSKYGGEYPNSEPETKAVVSFIRRENFDMIICFHSQGEEIYYDFQGNAVGHSEETARKMAAVSGYSACRPEGTAAFGGCKDWFIKEFSREGFTIEMGLGTNPLPLNELKNVYEPCAKIIICAMEEALRIK